MADLMPNSWMIIPTSSAITIQPWSSVIAESTYDQLVKSKSIAPKAELPSHDQSSLPWPVYSNQSAHVRRHGTTIISGFGKFNGKYHGADPEKSRQMPAHPIFGEIDFVDVPLQGAMDPVDLTPRCNSSGRPSHSDKRLKPWLVIAHQGIRVTHAQYPTGTIYRSGGE